jgi:hypothetical protein
LEMYKKCSLPVHFSLVLDDLITNRNIEYGSDDSISITIIFFFLLVIITDPNKEMISHGFGRMCDKIALFGYPGVHFIYRNIFAE